MSEGAVSSTGTLYLVSTPIGNMGDFSFRAVEVLSSVAVVLAEDTRHSRRLLDHYRITTPLVSHHEHNAARTTPGIIERLSRGESVALISDAGTPLLSDPGERLVASAIEAGIAVVPIPGASALLAALIASGISAEPFTFFGFLARKGRQRAAALESIASLAHTAVIYEAPTRVATTLSDLARTAGGHRRACVAREITKHFEEMRRGTLADLATYYENASARGEVVIIVGGAAAAVLDADSLEHTARELKHEGLSPRDIVRDLMQRGAPRNLAYRLAHADRAEAGDVPTDRADEEVSE